jgi:uncharacterized membrane protein YqhA
MKQKNKNAELSIEELVMKKKKLRGVIIGIGMVIIFACALLIYLAIIKKNIALVVVAISCAVALLPSFLGLNQIDEEIKSRYSK